MYKDLIIKLLSIKRVIAFILTLVFSYMAVIGEVKSTEFITIFSMIIAFYFGQSIARKEWRKFKKRPYTLYIIYRALGIFLKILFE